MAKKVTEEFAIELFMKNSLRPLVKFPGTQKPWKSKCLITGKIVSPTYGKVRDFGHRCIYCSRGLVSEKQARAVMTQAGLIPQKPFPGSNKPWQSKCQKCKKTTSPTFWNVYKGTGCKYCSGRAVDSKDAVEAMKKRGLEALAPFPGATKGWLVRCLKCKREFNAVFHSLRTKNGCKYCSGVAVVEREILEKMKQLNLKPLEPYKSAKIPWKCKCLVCNHIVQPTWSRIKQGRGHCAFCSQRRVDVTLAFKFMSDINLKPLVDFPGSNKPWLSICLVCDSEVSPRWSDLRQGQGACSNCADYGLNYQKPGYLYLITNSKLRAHKVGIANSYKSKKFDDRLYRHQKKGWELFNKIEFSTLQEASALETKLLNWLRVEVGLPFNLSSKQMPQGGHTETVSSVEISLESIWAKVVEMSMVKS